MDDFRMKFRMPNSEHHDGKNHTVDCEPWCGKTLKEIEKDYSNYLNVISFRENEIKKLEKNQITQEQLLDAYENEITNQAIDHAFDIDNVARELFGND